MQAGLQLVHTRSAVAEQGWVMYLLAVQDEQNMQRVEVVAVQGRDTYCPLTQEPHGSHTVSAVGVQAWYSESYFPAGHAVHETHGGLVKYGHDVARYVPAAQLERGTHTLDSLPLQAWNW